MTSDKITAQRAYLLHAISPLHVGVGQAAGAIDLPIARLKGSNLPYLPGSAVKGVLRDAFQGHTDQRDIFGPEHTNASDHAGALVTTDARLLLLPVRSLRGAFAWVTSPLLLSLAARDLKLAGIHEPPSTAFSFNTRGVEVANGSMVEHKSRVYLEDLGLQVVGKHGDAATEWAKTLVKALGFADDPHSFIGRFIVVDDDTMSFLWDTATQIDQRVSIDADTRTAKDGALWTEESLPAESVLIGLICASNTRIKDGTLKAEAIANTVVNHASKRGALQFGGKATVGRGRCIIKPFIPSEAK